MVGRVIGHLSREWSPGPQLIWLVSVSGPSLCNVLKSGVLSRRVGSGYVPACREEDGGFSPVQCDQAQGSCWCVTDSGEEVPETRVAGSQPACESKS